MKYVFSKIVYFFAVAILASLVSGAAMAGNSASAAKPGMAPDHHDPRDECPWEGCY